MNDETTYERLARMQETLRRLKYIEDAFPPGLRETLANIKRFTEPLRPLQYLMQAQPGPAVQTLTPAAPNGYEQAGSAPGGVTRAQARPVAVIPAPSVATPPASPDQRQECAQLLGEPTVALAAVPIVNMRAGQEGTDWTPQQRAALLAQIEGHPDWSRRGLKKSAYSDVEKAWGIDDETPLHVSTRKTQLALARSERRERKAGGAMPSDRRIVRQGRRQGSEG
jgi:hypothetical protein